jgi:Flp pilus assembly protein TadD
MTSKYDWKPLVFVALCLVTIAWAGMHLYLESQTRNGGTSWDTSSKETPDDAKYYLKQGLDHFHNGELDLAIKDFSQALARQPEAAAAYIDRGAVYLRKGDLDRALSDYDQSLQLNPKDARAYLNRGIIYGKKKDFDRALADFDRALEIAPRDAQIYYNQAVCLDLAGRPKPAIKAYQSFLQYASPYNRGHDRRIQRAQERIKSLANQRPGS